MVLESLIKASSAENRPFYVFLLGILYGAVGILFEMFVFKGRIESLFISITVFAAIPLMYKIIKLEEKRDKHISSEKNLLKKHKRALIAFIALFLGILVAFTFSYILMPRDAANKIFSSQIEETNELQIAISGYAIHRDSFLSIFFNNIKVLLFSFIFSFFFGAGAIFILTWNAALIAVALGSFIKSSLASFSALSSISGIPVIIGTISYAFFGYMTHGIFEISSYFLAGLSGGIVSVAVIQHDLFHQNFRKIVVDSLWLLALSILLLFFGSIVETFISPIIFS